VNLELTSKHKTQNTKHKVQSTKHEVQSTKYKARSTKHRVQALAGTEILMVTVNASAHTIGIKSIALHHVRVPLVEPFRISNGVISDKDAILVEVKTESDVVGWGEASPMSGGFYSQETPESAWSALSGTLIPAVLGAGEIDVSRFYEQMRSHPGDAFAKAGIEGALWDAYANTLKVSFGKLLGTRARPIPSGVAIGIYDHVADLLERVARYTAQGYRRVKIKIQPGWDIEPVAAVRARFPELPLMVDANAAYSLADATVFRKLDGQGLMMIEQPFARDAHVEAGELQRQLRTPLCADESAGSLPALASLIENEAARIINIKVQRVGGLSEARLMLAAARAAGLECWVGTMPELGVASAQGLHLATLDGFTYPTDIEASTRWYVDDVIAPLIEIDARGYVELPGGPGTGYRVVREKVERYSVASATFAN
jgi:O-succinylbenzoate synthase